MRDKTVAVEVKRIFPHPKYKKRITTSKKYQAHDPLNECNVGDWVTLGKCAPISKTKRFLVTDIRRKKVAGAQRHTAELNENHGARAPAARVGGLERRYNRGPYGVSDFPDLILVQQTSCQKSLDVLPEVFGHYQ